MGQDHHHFCFTELQAGNCRRPHSSYQIAAITFVQNEEYTSVHTWGHCITETTAITHPSALFVPTPSLMSFCLGFFAPSVGVRHGGGGGRTCGPSCCIRTSLSLPVRDLQALELDRLCIHEDPHHATHGKGAEGNQSDSLHMPRKAMIPASMNVSQKRLEGVDVNTTDGEWGVRQVITPVSGTEQTSSIHVLLILFSGSAIFIAVRPGCGKCVTPPTRSTAVHWWHRHALGSPHYLPYLTTELLLLGGHMQGGGEERVRAFLISRWSSSGLAPHYGGRFQFQVKGDGIVQVLRVSIYCTGCHDCGSVLE